MADTIGPNFQVVSCGFFLHRAGVVHIGSVECCATSCHREWKAQISVNANDARADGPINQQVIKSHQDTDRNEDRDGCLARELENVEAPRESLKFLTKKKRSGENQEDSRVLMKSVTMGDSDPEPEKRINGDVVNLVSYGS
ncbi:hypothetical protein RUM43_006937 [Polyplax serrata]|uniref:Uncharacterized protein n=1 Tax=Polyplax serrata TaxID=468196 RepID=A0AAN8S569_POLSC